MHIKVYGYVKANSKHMKSYDKDKELSILSIEM